MSISATAQKSSFNFHHLTTANGLSDPVIRCITQDKYGYIWLSTLNGLCRYNGYEVKVYQHILNDPFSLSQNYVPALLTDDAGRLWVALIKGIYRYDYSTGHFILQSGSNNISTTKMVKGRKSEIYISTSEGLVLFNTFKGTFSFLKNNTSGISKELLSKPVNDFCIDSDGNILLATGSGLIIYNTISRIAAKKILAPIKDGPIEKLAVDDSKNIWIGYGYNGSWLLKVDSGFTNYTVYNEFTSKNNLADNHITSIFTDNKGRVWLTTARSGLSAYDPAIKHFINYEHDPLQPMSISDNLTTVIYQDKQGFMWIGTEGNGVNYFHPDKTLFHSIQPSNNQIPTLPDNWCRAAGQDKAGNLWLGTASGLAKYDPRKNTYTLFQHTKDKQDILPFNSIRSVLCSDDWVWIGTAEGLNRYNIASNKMDAWGEKDKVPLSFYWTILKDHENNTWFGCRDGIYRYDIKTNKIESLINNQQLAEYARNNTLTLYEDSHNRIWFGFYSKGLLRYDPADKAIKYWINNDGNSTSLSDNHVTSITEDKNGIIWVATFDGLNSLNEKAGTFTQYLRGNSLASEKTSALMVDRENRLWFAASKGLCMLDASRKFFKYFDISDGLPTLDFNNQAAFKMSNGEFIYPTLKGFVQFNPDNYPEKKITIPDLYISSFKVFGNELATSVNFEEKNNISLQPNENFFSLEMVALNYANPIGTWYAHKLEPFDKEWIYSKERAVNYTNVPGGKYVFHYKTSTNRDYWNVAEKTTIIHLATVFYKTWWFILLCTLLILSGLYWIYRYRINQKEKLLLLERKAYSLQKEKALVMYESLKQQLNPHFLFNSLTSLSSLISSNPANAKQFLERMSKIYRYILKSRDSETVSLADEIKLAEIYSQLQQTRFKEGLQLKINLPEEFLHQKIAPVTLQNLIENAIKHNIIDVDSPLVISIFVLDGWVIVQNNLQKKILVESSNKQGLANMQSLYYYLSGKQIIMEEDENYFTVKIPLL